MMYEAHIRIHGDPNCPNIEISSSYYTERLDEFMYNDIVENYFYDHSIDNNKYSLLGMRICYLCRERLMRTSKFGSLKVTKII